MRVRIEPFDVEIEVADGATILEAALDAGIDYPFACQQGQCGSCKSILIRGRVDMGSTYNPLVCSDAERRRGAILACQSQPLEDCVVAVVELDGVVAHPLRDLRCVVASTDSCPGGIVVVRLAVRAGGPMTFAAGQSAEITAPGRAPVTAWMANLPDDDTLEFHLGPGSGEWHAGMEVAIAGPMGEGYLREEHLGPMIGVAEGAGLGGLLSIFGQALWSGMRQPMWLFVAAAGTPVPYCPERLESLATGASNLRVVEVTEPARLADRIAATVTDARSARAYVAAGPTVRGAVRAQLLARGIAPDFILEHAVTGA
jgi:CDP-4-dehydro-6-deoxyglucose reductase/ferredoxin-NAD(P)+ reductase (naphthalene dioxygenase ferredoxin-specific)